MAGQDDKELLDKGFEALADEETSEEQEALFEHLAQRIEEPGLQDQILARYQDFGKTLLGDDLPSRVDPRIAKALRPILGDVGNVRVHTGPVASAAAQAMNARAFAVGDQDVFVDPSQLSSDPKEAGALLAHEIAHTRDAATGFALSSKLGNDNTAREQFAHEVAHIFASEWDDDGVSVARDEAEPTGQKRPGGSIEEPKVDKVSLAFKVAEVLERQERLMGERTGRW
ncbi:MAG: hypothetical protein CVU56_06595 [Deltaproteobacteria bacterium HGW-Deltaproteobacteria-14]|jgi:hypothetical protein|nr:MAG: hypothetical protein CVU56_06595 [Deltaproteobacteria bacterium HGW-Deltaproteobacteria-14]